MATSIKRRNTVKLRFVIFTFVVVLLFVVAIVGPHFIKHDPYAVDLANVIQTPNSKYIMGTDYIGRCTFCRLIVGASRSVFTSLLVVAITMFVGVIFGALSGYIGGNFDLIFMRFVDSVQAFPSMVFTISVAAVLGGGMINCVLAMTVISWTRYCRLTRSQVLSLKEKTFVKAARISGTSSAGILFQTILPNVLPLIIVEATMHIGYTILSLSGMSFLGLGTAPPFPEWGTMLNDGREVFLTAPWAALFPGFAILIVVMVMGMFGDSVNELLNPKKKIRK